MIKLIQITDSHLGASPGDTLLSMNPDDSLADVLSLVRQQHDDIDLVLATGDIANGANTAAYQRFYQTVTSRLPAPLVWLPGNHDNPIDMDKIIQGSSGPAYRAITQQNWLLILLHSQVEGKTHGYLPASELQLLSTALSQYPEHHALIALHHQPMPIGSRWMDRYIVQNADEFWAVVDAFPQVKGVLWGHVHQAFDQYRQGVRLLASPSTCIQFAPQKDEFTIEDAMPGYRWLALYPNGQIVTSVERVPHKDYGIDFHSQGY